MNSFNAHPLTARPELVVVNSVGPANVKRHIDKLDEIIARLTAIENNMDTIIRTLEERSRPTDY